MAILKSVWLRGSRKKVAGMVHYQLKGQTIQREQAASVANPRTGAQMAQRLRLANLVSTYRAHKSWMSRGAFSNKLMKQSDYNAFVQANINNNTVYLTKAQASMGACVAAPYLVTKGILPSVTLEWVADANWFVSNINVGDLSQYGANITVAQLSKEILENNNGLRDGDQILCVEVYQTTSANGIPYCTVRYHEFIINTTLNENAENYGFTRWFEQGSGEFEDKLKFGDASTSAVAVIISREVSGKVQVSTQYLTLTPDAQLFTANYSNADAARRARASYGTSDNYVLNTNYAGDSNDDVPLDLSILTVNGISAGNVLQMTGTRTNFPAMTVLMSGAVPIGEVLANYVINGTAENDITILGQETIVSQGNNVLTIPQTNFQGDTLSNPYVGRVTLTINGVDYSIEFAEGTDPEITE